MALFVQNNAQTLTESRIEIVESNECKVRFDYVHYHEQGETASKSDLSGSNQEKPIAFREDKFWSFERSSSTKQEL